MILRLLSVQLHYPKNLNGTTHLLFTVDKNAPPATMRTRNRIIDRRPECSYGERQIDARNPFRNIREVPYERDLKLFATRRLG